MLPLVVVSALLMLGGLWWGLTVLVWIAWEKRFATPARLEAIAEASEKKPSLTSRIVDGIQFGLPSLLSIGLALDGLTGGRLLSAHGWTFPLPFPDAFQILGSFLLFIGLAVFTACANLTGRYVYARAPAERPLLQKGPYRFIRHPIYLSFMLVGGGFILLAQNLVMLPLVYAFTAVTYPDTEERELIELYGDAYREYRKRTGRFLPKFRRG